MQLLRPLICLAVALAVAASGAAEAQAQFAVSGTVTGSADNAPRGGVSVTLKGTNTGVFTNSSGGYQINARSAADTLVFTMLGFTTQEVAVGGRNVVNITLQQSVIALEGLVVVGYGTQARELVTGAVTSISTEELTRTSQTTVGAMLVGKVAGISSRAYGGGGTDGRPGSAPSLQVRNLGAPLYLINNVPADANAFNQLNPEDIESISILKDAAAAVYGFRAANGVVLVTTKTGSDVQGRPQLSISGYYGMQSIPRARSPFGYANNAYQFWYSEVESQQNRAQPRTVTAEELELYRISAPGHETYHSWPLVVDNQGAMQVNANVALSGSTENSSYRISLGQTRQDYTTATSTFQRTTLAASFSGSPFDNLRIGAELNGRVSTTRAVSVTEESDPVTLHWKTIQSHYPHQNPWVNGNRNYPSVNVRNRVRTPAIYRRDVSGTEDDIGNSYTGNFWAELTTPFGAKITARYSRTYNSSMFDLHRYAFNLYDYDEATDQYVVAFTNQAVERNSSRNNSESTFRGIQVDYATQIGRHSLSGVLGFEQTGGENTNTNIESIPPSDFNWLINYVNVRNATQGWGINRRASYLGRFNYDYDRKYLVEVLGRYDGSYLYAPDRRWGFFPGVSLGWRISEEPFFQDRFPMFTELKLRASWGETGRETGGAWSYLAGGTFGSGGSVLDGRVVQGVALRGLPNLNLSWETSTTRNAGIDFAIMNGRLSGEIDIFERKITGIAATRNDVFLPSELGYSLPSENLNSSANYGLDGMIRFSGNIGDMSYTLAPNFTISRAKTLELYNPRYASSWHKYRNATEYRWNGTRFLHKRIGQFTSWQEIARYPVEIDSGLGGGNRSLLPGDYIYNDDNGDGIVNNNDTRRIGYGANQLPILSFGLGTSFDYRGFSLRIDLNGGTMMSYNVGTDLRAPYQSSHNGGAYIWSRWRQADPYDDKSAWVPGRHAPVRKGQQNHSSFRMDDVTGPNITYLKVNRIELGYAIPRSLSTQYGISNARVYTSLANQWSIDNLATWTLDPEVTNENGQYYPTAAIINFGFSATLGGSR